jgi:hypothetical protein
VVGKIRTDQHDTQPYQLTVAGVDQPCWYREDELYCKDDGPSPGPSGDYEECKNRPSLGTPVKVGKVDSVDAGTCVAGCMGTEGVISTDSKDDQPYKLQVDGACGTCWFRPDELLCQKEAFALDNEAEQQAQRLRGGGGSAGAAIKLY